jgi:signal transduction histidine kinase
VRIDIERDTAGSVPLLFISVGDDGPGIPASERDAVLQRGTRLDESRPGSGLGLAIVDDLARLHGGSLRLGESALGGLDACLRLPAHNAPPQPFS